MGEPTTHALTVAARSGFLTRRVRLPNAHHGPALQTQGYPARASALTKRGPSARKCRSNRQKRIRVRLPITQPQATPESPNGDHSSPMSGGCPGWVRIARHSSLACRHEYDHDHEDDHEQHPDAREQHLHAKGAGRVVFDRRWKISSLAWSFIGGIWLGHVAMSRGKHNVGEMSILGHTRAGAKYLSPISVRML